MNDLKKVIKTKKEIDEILKKTEEKIKNEEIDAIPFEQFIKDQEEKRIAYYMLNNE